MAVLDWAQCPAVESDPEKLGGVWVLQGINVLLGSFMSGQPKWAIIGGVLIVVGIALLFAANRRSGVHA